MLRLPGPDDVLALKDIYELMPAAERERVMEEGRRRRNGDPSTPPHDQFQILGTDGSAVWLDVDLRPIVWDGAPAFHVAGWDITEQKRVEASRDLLAKAVNQAQDVVLITDAGGTILYANPATERATGYPLAEIIGANPRKFKSGSHGAELYDSMWKTLLGGDPWAGRMINRRRDGQPYHVESRIFPMREESGAITHYVSVQQDITERLRLEAQLLQAQKMQALGQLAGGVAHDFNNLLQVISGWTMLLLEELPPGHAHRRGLDRVDEAVQRGSALTRQLLAMSRQNIMQPKDVDVNALLPRHMRMLGPLLGEQVELQVTPGKNLGRLHADPGMIEQVILNLSINARDAMPAGGKLVIDTSNEYLGEPFCRIHTWARPGSFVRISVSDTGVGMAADIKEQIFKPFFTTKEPGKGTGLGLMTVAYIVQQHNGLIHVYSEPGLGSTFHVYFPVTVRAGATAAAPAEETVRAGCGEHVLLVEDDAGVSEVMIESLRRGGYRVEYAANGQQAMDLFLRGDVQFDLVILDMVLPKMSGRQAFELMHAARPGTRFLFSSGYSPHVMDVEFLRDRNVPLVQKPYAPRQLLAAVGRLLDGEGNAATAPRDAYSAESDGSAAGGSGR